MIDVTLKLLQMSQNMTLVFKFQYDTGLNDKLK